MSYRWQWIGVTAVIGGLCVGIPVAHAERQAFENVWCGAATHNVLIASKDFTAMTNDAKGVLRSTQDSKLFDNWTTQSVNVIKGQEGKWFWNGYGKRMAPDGDFIIVEISGSSDGGAGSKLIYGTGKWTGIKGEMKVKRFTAGKPISQGTDQFCEHHEGWFELPK